MWPALSVGKKSATESRLEIIVKLSKTQTTNTDNRANQSKFKANTCNRFAKGNYEVWENTCHQVTVGDHCSAETRIANHERHR